MKILNRISMFLVALVALTACSMEDPEGMWPEKAPLSIDARIGRVETRAERSDSADLWSYVNFQTGDEMGFYSSSGKWESGSGNHPFINEELIFNEGEQRFTGPNGVEFSPTNINGSKVLMYFPYDSEMDDDGMTLRVTDPVSNDGILRCVDFLDAYELTVMGELAGNKTALFGSFQHAFAELIIMRGEGFDNPPEGMEKIKVYTQDPITNIKVVVETEEGWSCEPKLVYNANNQHNLDVEGAKEWEAWQGLNYGKTIDNTEGYEAWYVIIPTIGCEVGPKKRPGDRTIVNYIELYDNEGELQRVSSLRLSGANTKYVDATWRYPMLIAMKELVPTANPVNIVPWDDDVNLTDERKRGINNVTEFAEWVKAYNAYLIDNTQTEALFKYGDLYISDDETKIWHFYLLADIDMDAYYLYIAGKDEYNGTVVIPELKDILDGISTTYGSNGEFINHKVYNLSTTFIGTLSGNGELQSFDFIEPDVRPSGTMPVGIIANEISGGTINNCNIENGTLVHTEGPAGFVAGTMSGGVISNCVLEGSMVSASTATGNAARIVGTNPTGDAELKNINAQIIANN